MKYMLLFGHNLNINHFHCTITDISSSASYPAVQDYVRRSVPGKQSSKDLSQFRPWYGSLPGYAKELQANLQTCSEFFDNGIIKRIQCIYTILLGRKSDINDRHQLFSSYKRRYGYKKWNCRLYPSFCVNTIKCKKRKCIFERSFIDLLIAF